MVDQKNVLTKCLLLLEKCPWNGTWVKPFHSGNVHRDENVGRSVSNMSAWDNWANVWNIVGKIYEQLNLEIVRKAWI
jgi:hypothetical protein